MADNNRRVPIVAFVFVILSFSLTVDACFPAKYWISCLIDTCKLGGKCPGDETATCRMEKSECNGCKATWFTANGGKANCSAPKNLKLCPSGEVVVHCKVDSCKWPCAHPDFKGASCRQSYCGECSAEYLIKDAWMKCPVATTGTKGETLPVDTIIGDTCISHPCSIDVCMDQRCPAVSRAVCRPATCGTCRATWFLDNQPVDCTTGQFTAEGQSMNPIVSPPAPFAPWQRTCANGVSLSPCDMKVCEQKICRNFPNAECRPDGCGGCKDTWYVDNILVDCLSDECPPKVPFVKCVDDPCKYFGHYCPAAECRASQCGKCEAKFFANGQEIDCAMPSKECKAGVRSRVCPWYTCPANICPSNRRLMCRINPCGQRCDYEFVDIYNGEILPCRVFDGDGTPRHTQKSGHSEITLTDTTQIPRLGNLVPQPTPLGVALPQSVEITQAVASNAMVKTSSVGNGFNVEPLLVNPGPPITDTDLLSILRSFPHEMINIPSASIQTALKKDTGAAATAIAQQGIVLPSQHIGQQEIALPPQHMGQQEIALPPQHMGQQGVVLPSQHMGQQGVVLPSQHMGQQEIALPPQHMPINEPRGVIDAGKPQYLDNVNPTFPQQNNNIPVQQNPQPFFETGSKTVAQPNSILIEQNQPFVETRRPVMQQQNMRFPQQIDHTFDQRPMITEPVSQEQVMPNQLPAQSMKNFFTSPDTSFGNQLLDFAKTDTNMFREIPAKTPFRQDLAGAQGVAANNNIPDQPKEPLYPELNQVPTRPIAAGKPKTFKSQVIGQKQKAAVKVTQTNKAADGVPISMHMFSQWASM